jgi:hypothetical protein
MTASHPKKLPTSKTNVLSTSVGLGGGSLRSGFSAGQFR